MNNPTSPYSQSLLKFRPVLTLEQIKQIIYLTQEDDSFSDFAGLDPDSVNTPEINKSIRRVLIPLLAKIEVGAINPAYKLSEIHAVKMAESAERQRYENDLMSPEEMLVYENKLLGI
jgi:hypothetical protein